MVQCPWLPSLNGNFPLRHGPGRGVDFYFEALSFAQGYWMRGKPAQAILQLDKAFSADLTWDEGISQKWPWPYEALVWILKRSEDGSHGFLGNPVRHFQHLATRLTGPGKETRIIHAWNCFHLSRRILAENPHYPIDGRQLAREGIFLRPPTLERLLII